MQKSTTEEHQKTKLKPEDRRKPQMNTDGHRFGAEADRNVRAPGKGWL
jgi:hypothetical protein